jgi:hypothetical protein
MPTDFMSQRINLFYVNGTKQSIELFYDSYQYMVLVLCKKRPLQVLVPFMTILKK